MIKRNRFKNRAASSKGGFRWPRFAFDWRRHWRKAAALSSVGVCFGALCWALDRPVHVISMDGPFQRVSPGQIEKAITPYTSAGFMSADLDAIERAVEALPWVDRARVERRWPNSLHVTVVEQTAAARWGEAGLLNTRGELFDRAAAHVPSELPRLSGPDGTETAVAQRYLAAEARLVEAGLRIAALRLDERGAWEIDLDSGVTVRLGRQDVDERLDRFVRTAAAVIRHHSSEVSYVDMRYSNGFSIGWRTPGLPVPPPSKGAQEFNG
jgi:cell division protein FtsQ